MADSQAPASPPLAETMSWTGFEMDEVGGSKVGRVRCVFVDVDSGEPAWLIATLDGKGGLLRRRGVAKTIAIPSRDCAGAAGRVWTAHGHESLRTAPSVDPGRPLLREHELTICSHYGIGEPVGRAAEVVGRPEGSVTSQPA